jgi:tricorn protease
MKNIVTVFLLFLFFFEGMGQEEALWLRYPAISPDGQTIVFSYKGDLFKVAAEGGAAYPLTLHEAYDHMPVWSHDGQQIAFASDRYGNFDVFVMNINGGKANRLTYHSAADFPSDFSPDNQSVIFTSSRLDDVQNQQFPSGVLPELYTIPADGGRPEQVLTTPAEFARYDKNGTRLVYHDRKGYEDAFRKHHTSSVTRDIWLYDLNAEEYTQLSSFDGEDRNPVFAPSQNAVYYLSEEKGDFNIFKMDLGTPGQNKMVSSLKNHPVRYLTISDDGLMCFSYNGELYTLKEGQQAQKVNIFMAIGDRYNPEKIEKVSGDITEFALSSNGKEIAFIVRGEIFASSVETATTKRITNTPEQERSVSFSPDGRAILYASERNGSWNVYQTKLAREEEPYFYASTILNEEPVIETAAEEFQPHYSPDGKEVAYLEERTALKVINLESKKSRLIMPADRNYSYSDGDQHYEWSPDSKWFLVNFLQPEQWTAQVGLVSAQGGDITDLTQSGFGGYTPRWMMDGKMVMWASNRDGMANVSNRGGELDVYALFFDQEDYDRFTLSKEDYELLKESEKEDEKEDEKEEEKEKEEQKELEINLDNIQDRKVRLTRHSSRLNDAIVSKDGSTLYYLAQFEKGYDLWQTDLRTKETKLLAKLGANNAGYMAMDKKGEHLFLLASGKVHKVAVKSGDKKGVPINGEMILNEEEERAYLFDHIWRQVDKKFYKKNLHEVSWEFYNKEYQRFLPHINNNYDFMEMLSEMLGELNASHTGARYRPNNETGDQTAALGLFFDNAHQGDGLKVAEVMAKSPLDNSDSKVKAGTIIEKIDGEPISAKRNHFMLLNRKAGKKVLLSLYDPESGERWEETTKPISWGAQNQLLYKRWVENCRAMVDELSGGKIGYVHVRGMNDASYRVVIEEVLGKNANKEALVVDTRFNGGGWLHDNLVTFLDGKKYITFMPRGQNLGGEPQGKWKKPSIVVMSESNYSDAHMFPFAYKELDIGKLVGMPVPGTGTAVWWESLQNGMVFGIPQVGMVANNGDYLENTQLEPDIKVPNEPGKVRQGVDQQLEAAVKELMKIVFP